MLNRRFFTYASLLALVAVPAAVGEVSRQDQTVYAAEVTAATPVATESQAQAAVAEEISDVERASAVTSDESEIPAIRVQEVEAIALNDTLTVSQDSAKKTNQTGIEAVRQSPQNASYTISGKIISPVDGWGGKGFYVQDNSGSGLYIYPDKKDFGFNMGDSVEISGTLSHFNGELQLKDITAHKKVSADFSTPVVETSIPELENAKPSTLVKISNVTVGKIKSEKYETSSFDLTDASGRRVAVRLDNRTGIKTSDLMTKVNEGDVINLTAIHSTFKNKLQLKPFSLDQFEIVKPAVRKEEIAPEYKLVKIGQIQGESHVSPLLDQAVRVEKVVVTYLDDETHFYVQDLKGDGNRATSDGIRVFVRNTAVKVGDVLDISGTVEEFFGKGFDETIEKTDLTMTQIKAAKVTKTGTSQLPAPIILGKDRMVPKDIIDNDGLTVFDPQEDAIDYWESMEGMLVAVDDAKILGPMNHKEIYVLPGSTKRHLNNSGGVLLQPGRYNTDIIPISFKEGNVTIKSGDYFTGRIAGPVGYSYGNYKVFVDDKTLPKFNDGQLKPEKTHIIKDLNKLSIASYNIENFSANPEETKDEKVKRIAQSFIHDLNSPDIIGLIEVQDNNGSKNDGTTDATLSANRLIDAIKALGGPTYVYLDIAPENNVDGGKPGSNIRNGFLYQPSRVRLSDKPRGGANDALTWKNGELNMSLGRIAPTDAAWKEVRKSLAAEFIFQGNKVVVVANHLNSKRGDDALYGRMQPVTFKSEEKRHILAKILRDFAKEGSAHQANIVMLGDFNDFEFTKTIQLIEEGNMTNLVSRHDLSDRYSYFYQGNNQTLDNLLVSSNLLNHYEFDMVHVNSPFMEAHGRASDHDPLLIQLSFAKANTSRKAEPMAVSPMTVTPKSEGKIRSLPQALSAVTKAASHSEEKGLPKTGDKASFVMTLLGITSLLSVFGLFSKKQEVE
ncbi:LPXTG cell wall anchor domain-containing protein [Streptococcus catagoni]|uniref:LPXTG cell wall anchor domain-containing protein n=1 Tax=Streptococcus catagoni TaxID=2654874 RepID=UPI00140BBE4F|nr:endonuclease/exonuclease/phosphatase family protein [Streptococcus catagoni]